jgi:hypothetical protein
MKKKSSQLRAEQVDVAKPRTTAVRTLTLPSPFERRGV